jgi:hypothetical protein
MFFYKIFILMKYLLILIMVLCFTCKSTNPPPPPPPPPTSSQPPVLDTIPYDEIIADSAVASFPDYSDNMVGSPMPPMSPPPPPPPVVGSTTPIFREDGRFTYDIPDTMQVGKTYIIKVRITRQSNPDASFLPNSSSPSIAIRTSGTMQVEIVDPHADKAFDVVKSNSSVQIVDTLDYTEWQFALTPVRSGIFQINIITSIIIDGNKKEKVYEAKILVKANHKKVIKSFWSKHWQWLFTTLFIPFGVFIYKRRKESKNDK